MCEPKSSPKYHVKQGGGRVPGCQEGGRGAKEEGQLRAQQAAASAAVGAPMWQCLSLEPPGGSEAAHGADSGGRAT